LATLLHIPTEIILGDDALTKAGITGKQLLLVYNPKMPIDVLNQIHRILKESDNIFVDLGFQNGEPDSDRVNRAFAEVSAKTELILAIGGGSLIDFAKAIGVLLYSGGDITDYEFGDRVITGTVPVYVIPTVFGSGSEVTPYTVINNSVTGRKFTLGNTLIRPMKAIVQPSLIDVGISDEIKLISGIDAFIHCFEALVSRQETELIQPFALEGLRKGWTLLPEMSTGKSDFAINDKLAFISLYGGISIAHCRTGLIHTLSVAFAKYISLPHGLLNASMVKYAVGHHLPHYNGLLAYTMNNALHTSFSNDAEAYEKLQQWFDQLIQHLGRPISFTELPDAEHIVDRLLQDKGLPDVSHGQINEEQLRKIVNQIIDENRS